MFDRFRGEREGAEMVAERDGGPEAQSSRPETEPPAGAPAGEIPGSEIGIVGLIDKRAKLEEAIDYVGLMIKSLKDKRTSLEKEIEEESVDIKNLKEKLEKVHDYIEEENRGIQDLVRKRSDVEHEADEVAGLISGLRGKLAGIDGIIDAEKSSIKKLKESGLGPGAGP